jgi:uncharacterized phage protein (TIGR02218 family)
MKTLTPALQTHLNGDTTLAELILITRTDGVVKAFTTCDRNLTVGGVTYLADGSFSLAALENDAALKANDCNATGLLDSALIAAADLEAGLYDHARVDVFICNWADLSQGTVQIRRGWLGEVTLQGGQYTAAFRGLQDLLQRKVGDIYTPECRYDLGDARCGVSLGSYAGTVTAVTDAATFTDSACASVEGVFNYGQLTWVSGANQGLSMEVKNWDGVNQLFTLWLTMPNMIAVGDAYQVTTGCDKCFATCINKFNNGTNFGGFPHLPGLAKILQYPQSS